MAEQRGNKRKPLIGLALGSGAARGWAHIGVIRELEEIGLRPDIVAGSSVGSVVGGAYASGNLDRFEEWISGLGRLDIIRLLDAGMTGGGFLQGKRLMDAIRKQIGDPDLEDLEFPLACVATELETGREIWLRKGSLLNACRASIALPGMFAPARADRGELLIDGGLVNPVPVSLARAMGADVVIAVNLNGDLVGRHFFAPKDGALQETAPESQADDADDEESAIAKWAAKMKNSLGVQLESYISPVRGPAKADPGLFDVIAGSLNIMQDRITRSRMAGEPPDIHIAPRLSQIGLMDFNRAAESIEEGRAATRRQGPDLEGLMKAVA